MRDYAVAEIFFFMLPTRTSPAGQQACSGRSRNPMHVYAVLKICIVYATVYLCASYASRVLCASYATYMLCGVMRRDRYALGYLCGRILMRFLCGKGTYAVESLILCDVMRGAAKRILCVLAGSYAYVMQSYFVGSFREK